MQFSRENFISACGIGIAVWLMTPAMHGGPLVLDEHAAYWLCAPDNSLSIWERSVRYAAAPPLASWVQAASLTVLGETELALRLPSMLAFVLAVGVMAVGGRKLLGGRPAALAACVLALHPDVVDEVRVGRTYGLVTLWMTILVLLTLRWHASEIGWRHALGWGLTAAASVWTHVLTIPVVGMAALMLAVWDVRECRSLRPPTIAAWLLAGLLCLPLVPMGERIWEWRYALNYQTGTISIRDALGPFVWLSLPIGACAWIIASGVRFVRRRSSSAGRDSSSDSAMSTAAIWTAVALGLVPLAALVVAGQSELSSLAQPRYRVPLVAANACLLGVLCAGVGPVTRSCACMGVCLAATWTASGHTPWQLVRLRTPQAAVWQDMGKTLDQTIHEQHLERAPVFVQSGLIEGVLIPAFPEDIPFHGYVSSRLGRFYARTPNPRYALPLLWTGGGGGGGDNRELLDFYARILRETAARPPNDLFVAVATDTDLNRSSFETFTRFLEEFGYKGVRLAGQEPWAVLYHYRR